MKQFLLIFVISFFTISFSSIQEKKFAIESDKIDQYLISPITDSLLLGIIQHNPNFINLKRNPYISEATLEHHLIEKIESGGNSTFIVFEYFSLEGISCNLKAVTLNKHGELQSILRLADYNEYPDGELNEYSHVKNDIIHRTTVVNGLVEYVDSIDAFKMRCDSIFVSYKLNSFKSVELIDSVYKKHEYLSYPY